MALRAATGHVEFGRHGTVTDMRSALSLALAVALTTPPGVARAAGWSQAQRDTHDKIIGLENVDDLAGAVQLAVQEFADVTAPAGYRRAVARRGKTAALALFARTKDDSDRLTHLCTAVELMRVYDAELLESEDDRRDVPLELARLEAQATAAAAPCARLPTAPTPPVRTDVSPEASPRPMPEPLPALPIPARRSRPRLAVGAGLVTAGVGLAAGFAGCFAGRVPAGDRVIALDEQATAAGRALTSDEMDELLAADARYVRLSNTGKALGVAAGVALLAGVLVLALPARTSRRMHARVAGAGVHINF